MSSSEQLTLAFLESHPADAARVLEKLPTTTAAALLQTVPLRFASPVLRHMLPLAGARCLEPLEDSEVAGLLRGIGAQAGVALLRHFAAERRGRLLVQLPTTINIAYELLLGYPEDAVGAWMDPRALALPAEMTVDEALERVRHSDESLIADPFVVDRKQRLLGYVEFADLLRARNTTPLIRLVRPSPHRLPAQSLLIGLRDHSGWREASTLPIVEKDDRLVGALTHAAFQRALSIAQNKPELEHPENTLSDFVSLYWLGVSALIEAMVGLLPVERRKEGER